jgi:acetoacetyl-CoA synthetase
MRTADDGEAGAGHAGRVVWTPSERRRTDSALARFLRWLDAERGLAFDGYDDLWRWSVDDLDTFWRAIWDFFEVRAHAGPTTILTDRSMPGAVWFPGTTLNYAEIALTDPDDRPAIAFRSEDGLVRTLTRGELAAAVGAAAAGLRRLGVGAGDRVAAFVPNTPEAVIAFLATASLGAIWSSCSPDFGAQAVVERFRQIEPSVLIAVDGYRYGGRWFDRADVVREILAALPGTACVAVPSAEAEPMDVASLTWDELTAVAAPLEFEPVAFEHPLWILYSSGTTGAPKAMVQGHGGIVLEHLKSLALHLDLGPDDRFFWFTTTGWMMWNFLVGGLLVGSTIVLYDGSPTHPDLGTLWRLAQEEHLTYLGVSAPFLHACMKAHLEPNALARLDTLGAIGSTGAPLSPEAFGWVAAHVGADVWLGSISGGTDVCTAVVTSCPMLPVRVGEIQCRGLGAKVESFDPEGRPLTGEVGELVITEPTPSMPVSFWGDPDGAKYRASYFETFPGVWRHGDWIEITPGGGCIIYGRSDATLNRGGIRVGTSELYRVVEAIPGVRESLVVDTGELGHEGELILFVALDGRRLDDPLRATIADAVRSQLSPRHVPDRIVEAPGIPTTLNGKRLEVPVKRMLMGEDPAKVASPEALRDPEIFAWYVAFATREHRREPPDAGSPTDA